MKKAGIFDIEYKKLNKAQKEAVDTTEGPVMVIAGPGTGKTQVLSLRIGNILEQTDTPADGVLCLTFTNSGVDAMKKRLRSYGVDTTKVAISTFHAFGSKLIEEFHQHLGLHEPPATLDEASAVGLVDDILNDNDWEHLRPRGDASRYFHDLKSLTSLLIREGLTPEAFGKEIDADIRKIKKDPENISSRGATKGELKKEGQNKIEALERTREAVTFYELYEEAKRERNLYDYDDILRAMVRLAAEFEDVRAALRERHLYVLVDEHQDSSSVQNEFLKLVWGPVEKPNVFVVGDDRQLIYGFSGASVSLFEEFRETFPGTKLITLTENYRSTQRILDVADTLLKSLLAKGKLSANRADDHPMLLSECADERHEILRAGIFFKERMKEGVPAEECALLVPKNSKVRTALRVLTGMGLAVSAPGSAQLFETEEFKSIFTLLKLVANSFDAPAVATFVLDPISGIVPLEAHRFLHGSYSRGLSVEKLAKEFPEVGGRVAELVNSLSGKSAYEAVEQVGKVFLLDSATSHEALMRSAEVMRTLLNLALAIEEKSKGKSVGLADFVDYLSRLEEYGEDIPLTTFGEGKGIRVMTLHRSKGLEFEAVWVAHLSERSLMSGKRMGLTLPEKLKILQEKKDQAAARRELYVAITRAKHFAALSFPILSHSGAGEELAAVLEEVSREHFEFEDRDMSKKKILAAGIAESVSSQPLPAKRVTLDEVKTLVTEHFHSKKVSASALNSFFECPWQWYFRYFLGLPEPQAEAMVFGSVVHAAIEILLKHKEKPDAAVEAALDAEHVFEPNRRRRMKNDAVKALKRFQKEILPNLYDEYECEKPLSAKDKRFPDLHITGKIDLMEHAGAGAVRLTDFKTGRPRKASEIEKRDEEGRLSSYLRQLAMYSYLLEHASKGQYEVERSRLYFAESDDAKLSLYEVVIGRDELDLLLNDITDYAKLLEKGGWAERSCAYKGQTECPYCALKKRLFQE